MGIRERFLEVVEQFGTVVAGRTRVVDAVLPPLTFLVLNVSIGLNGATWGSLAMSITLSAVRLIRGEALGYAMGGLAATLLAILTSRLTRQAQGYFLPSLVSGGVTALICLASVIVGRPLVALTSHLARGWPLAWYWHPRIRPAYSEVTLAWAIFFSLRSALQWLLFREGDAAKLGTVSLLMGWPATILLLAASYLYGTWRLGKLSGPSVNEFEEGAPPPFSGQQQGF